MAFTTPAGAGFQNHHVLPEALRSHPVLKILSRHGLFNIDDVLDNRLRLPTKENAAKAANMAFCRNTACILCISDVLWMTIRDCFAVCRSVSASVCVEHAESTV